MSDGLTRLAIVMGAVAVAALVTLALRWPRRRGERVGGIAPGIYLFSSTTCADCAVARSRLVGELGADGFIEVDWETQPDLFARMGIDVVPTTLLVRSDSSSDRMAGDPEVLLRGLGP
jgi:hypothetical protein